MTSKPEPRRGPYWIANTPQGDVTLQKIEDFVRGPCFGCAKEEALLAWRVMRGRFVLSQLCTSCGDHEQELLAGRE